MLFFGAMQFTGSLCLYIYINPPKSKFNLKSKTKHTRKHKTNKENKPDTPQGQKRPMKTNQKTDETFAPKNPNDTKMPTKPAQSHLSKPEADSKARNKNQGTPRKNQGTPGKTKSQQIGSLCRAAASERGLELGVW